MVHGCSSPSMYVVQHGCSFKCTFHQYHKIFMMVTSLAVKCFVYFELGLGYKKCYCLLTTLERISAKVLTNFFCLPLADLNERRDNANATYGYKMHSSVSLICSICSNFRRCLKICVCVRVCVCVCVCVSVCLW